MVFLSSVGIPYMNPFSRDWRTNAGKRSGVNQSASRAIENHPWTWRSTRSGIQSMSSDVQGPAATTTASNADRRSASDSTTVPRSTRCTCDSMAWEVAVKTDDVDAALGDYPRGGGTHHAASDHRDSHEGALLGRDSRDGLSRFHGLADLEEKFLDDAGDGGGDLGVDLVGVHLHQGLAFSHVLAALLAPGTDGDLLGALQLRHHDLVDLNSHSTIL